MESEGNLLEGADLTHEWSLPALPADHSPHPSTSQELADIFGTSDDEDEGNFPYSSHLTVPKAFEDIALSNKSYSSSLLGNVDSELFLAGFEPKTESPVKQDPAKQPDKDVATTTTDCNEATPTEPDSNSAPNDNGNHGDTETMKEAPESTEASNDKSDPEGKKEEPGSGQPRKSARLQARKPHDDELDDPALQHALALSEGQEATPTHKEPSPAPESESESDEDSDDPNKLYCICRKPHNDKFMICCDTCEDWFHGSCVGITVAQGKRMEREGKDYVCPLCSEKLVKTKEEIAAGRTARQNQRELTREKAIKKKLAALGVIESPSKRRRVSGESDSYGISQLFLPDNAPKSSGEVSSTSDNQHQDFITNKCVVSDCDKSTSPPSIYCSQGCIERHVSSSLRKLVERGVAVASSPSDVMKGSGGIVVIDKALNKVIVGSNAPSEQELLPWLKAHPSYQVLIPPKGKKKDKLKSPSKLRHETKKEEIKYPKIALMDPDSVRANAKKALFQILWKRREDAPDMSDVDQSEVERIADDIEEKLFNLNQEINPKYKNKYRSLIFNLKDTKNQGLFRKVLRKEFSSKELVRMTIEKLASDELAAWRQSTLKKDLDMIKAREEETSVLGEVIRKITHKGEVEIDSSELREKMVEDVPTTVVKASDEQVKTEVKPSSKTKPKSDSKAPDTTSNSGILALLKDTTSEHGKHLYDQHCDICTGKIPAPSNSPIQSPDSHMPEEMDTTESKTSPDSAAVQPHPDTGKMVWEGSISMVGLSSFNATASPVSGYSSDLGLLLPTAVNVKGRIAYAQVWDYLDKIRSASTRDIVVVQFSSVAEDKESHDAMFTYLMRKHRSGVIVSGGQETIKDMYLVPLPATWDVPSQLLPIRGPGLPADKGDIMLGVIVRTRGSSSRHTLSHTSPATRIRAEVTLKRRHSEDTDAQHKKSKVEVGFGGQTPPMDTPVRAETSLVKRETSEDDEMPYSPSTMYEDKGEESKEPVQMSFYGEHQPAKPDKTVTTTQESTPQSDINTSAMATSLRNALNLPPTANIQGLLANLSGNKLKELASAVSSLEKISDGPIDQSTLAAAGTTQLRAAFSGDPNSTEQASSSTNEAGGGTTHPNQPSFNQPQAFESNQDSFQGNTGYRNEWEQRHYRNEPAQQFSHEGGYGQEPYPQQQQYNQWDYQQEQTEWRRGRGAWHDRGRGWHEKRYRGYH